MRFIIRDGFVWANLGAVIVVPSTLGGVLWGRRRVWGKKTSDEKSSGVESGEEKAADEVSK